MTAAVIHPEVALYQGVGGGLPQLAACEHYAGSEKLLRKALAYRSETGLYFDITADCEDGAPIGGEIAHAEMIAALLNEATASEPGQRNGARIHDITHPLWQEELDVLIRCAGARLAYLVLPKPRHYADVHNQIAALNATCLSYGLTRQIPVHVLIETPGALHDVWQIAALPQVETLDFGLMDFVSEHHGAIPASAMRSPGQFDHPLIHRAKTRIASAALGNGRIPAHNVTTEFRDLTVVAADARRAREDFGFLRMWSIHPAQIAPIIEAIRPPPAEIEEACAVLTAAQDIRWGPIQINGRLHDRASYRYYWAQLRRAKATGMTIDHAIQQRFFPTN